MHIRTHRNFFGIYTERLIDVNDLPKSESSSAWLLYMFFTHREKLSTNELSWEVAKTCFWMWVRGVVTTPKTGSPTLALQLKRYAFQQALATPASRAQTCRCYACRLRCLRYARFARSAKEIIVSGVQFEQSVPDNQDFSYLRTACHL